VLEARLRRAIIFWMGTVFNSPCFWCSFVPNYVVHYTTFQAKDQGFIGRDEGFRREKAQKAQKKRGRWRNFFDRITGWKTDDKKSRRKVKDLIYSYPVILSENPGEKKPRIFTNGHEGENLGFW